MFNQADFGKRLRLFRKKKNFTQKEIAFRIGVSEQAVSKWENGECLPDVYNLKILGKVLRIPVDTLLDTENDKPEKVIEIIKVGGAEFEIIEKPETILAGKMIYAKDYKNMNKFNDAIEKMNEDEEKKQAIFSLLQDNVLPIADIHLSVNFWLHEKVRAFGFVREVATDNQP